MTGTVTERILPAADLLPRTGPAASGADGAPAAPARPVAWPVGGRTPARTGDAAPQALALPLARAARLARPRGEALLSTTTRAGMLVGVSAAVYAVSLAGVSGLQAQSQADVAAQHQPAIEAVAQAKAANDALEAAIQDADARARALTADYGAVSKDMTAYQAQFAQLSDLVARIQGTAAKLNASFKLPTVSMHGAISGGTSSTTVVTTTSASGKP